jgi:hypothetical protein
VQFGNPARITVVLAGLALAACETPWEADRIALINNSNQQIVLTDGYVSEVVFNKHMTEFAYPNPDGMAGGTLIVETSQCRIEYQVPYVTQDYPWRAISKNRLVLQLESDFKLYAVPPNATAPARFSDFARLQTGDFPVVHDEMRCPHGG